MPHGLIGFPNLKEVFHSGRGSPAYKVVSVAG